MERIKIGAILDSEFEEFLSNNQLLDEFKNGNIQCSFCNETITLENIAFIFYKDGYQFCCNNKKCNKQFNERK